MEKENNLIKIIETNNFSIKNNPFGTKRLWPYSYIELFYNSFCKKLYKINQSPSILEVNQENIINLEIWNFFFNEPNIKNISLEKIKRNEYEDSIKFDMIIVENKEVLSNKKILSKLISSLNPKGVLVIENIGRAPKNIIRIFQKYYMKLKIDIHDFRYNRFILKNCILLIENKKNKFSIFDKIQELILLFKFLFTEFIISLLLVTLKIK